MGKSGQKWANRDRNGQMGSSEGRLTTKTLPVTTKTLPLTTVVALLQQPVVTPYNGPEPRFGCSSAVSGIRLSERSRKRPELV